MTAASSSEQVNITLSEADYYTLILIKEYSRPPANNSRNIITKGTIKLPLPVQLPADQYSARTQNEDLGFIGAAIETYSSPDFGDKVAAMTLAGAGAAGALFGALKGLQTRNRNETDSKKSGSSFESILTGAGVGLKTAEEAVNNRYTGAYGGVVKNPRTALLFQGMNLRSFQFTFRLTPRTHDESKRYFDMLTTLKTSMHPSFNKTFNSYVLDYPALFSCGFFSPNGLIFGAPAINNAFLTNLKIDSSQTNNNFFKDGVPPVIDVSMEFDEIESLTKESITGNFNSRSASEYFSSGASGGIDTDSIIDAMGNNGG